MRMLYVAADAMGPAEIGLASRRRHSNTLALAGAITDADTTAAGAPQQRFTSVGCCVEDAPVSQDENSDTTR